MSDLQLLKKYDSKPVEGKIKLKPINESVTMKYSSYEDSRNQYRVSNANAPDDFFLPGVDSMYVRRNRG